MDINKLKEDIKAYLKENMTGSRMIIRETTTNMEETLRTFIIWIFLAVFTGLFIGGCSVAFVYCINYVTAYRESHSWIVYCLPLAGICIVFLYGLFNYKNDKGTNLILSTIHAEDHIPFRMAPLIFISTVLTHAFGGSAGREGAALQLGGSLGSWLSYVIDLDENDSRVLVMCGMSAAFSAMFGTPMAAAIFAMEVGSIGVMHYSALVPCVFSSLTASLFATHMELFPESHIISNVPTFDIAAMIECSVFGILCALLSMAFCILLHGTGDLYRKHLKNPYVRIIFSSCLIIALSLILGTQIYNGSGMHLIDAAFEGDVPRLSFFWKMVFTALTLEAGFKGGEIVPSFTIGATFGCLFANFFGLNPGLFAAVGMASVFCGVTNCPITSMIIGFELFGFKVMPFMLMGVAISYMLSGYYSLYTEQTIVYSKYKTQYINKKTKPKH